MGRRRNDPASSSRVDTLNLSLGAEVKAQLRRARDLLQASAIEAREITRAETARIAIRRLLLVLLGERANPSDPTCSYWSEYCKALDSAERAGELLGSIGPVPIPQPPPNHDGPTNAKRGRKGKK